MTTNLPENTQWGKFEKALRSKFKIPEASLLSPEVTNNPETLIPVIERAEGKEVVPILLNTIHNLYQDNMKGKDLARKVVAQYSSKPAVVRKKIIKKEPGNEDSEIIEFQSFTRQEMNELRGLLLKAELTDVDWLLKIYEKGGNTLVVSGDELIQVLDAVEIPKLRSTLQKIIEEEGRQKVQSIWQWVAQAWRLTFPTVDFSSSQFSKPWFDWVQLQQLLRKLTLLNGIYQDVEPWESTNVDGILRCLIRNAPEQYRMQVQNLLVGASTPTEIREKLVLHMDIISDQKFTFQTKLRGNNQLRKQNTQNKYFQQQQQYWKSKNPFFKREGKQQTSYKKYKNNPFTQGNSNPFRQQENNPFRKQGNYRGPPLKNRWWGQKQENQRNPNVQQRQNWNQRTN